MLGAVQVAILAFLIVILIMRGITATAEGKSDDVVNRVRMYSGGNNLEEKEERLRKKGSLISVFAAISRLFTPKKLLDSVEADLIQADVALKPEEMISINIAAAVLPSLFAALILHNTFLAIILFPIGAYAPLVFLKNAKTKRSKKFNDQLGDALGIMANSLRAGFSFLQTMDSLSKELPEPICTEFGRALKEMRLGTPTEDALKNMVRRVRSDDLELVVTAVNIQRQVGGNLAVILDNIAGTINERVRMKGEIKTLTAQGRISGMIISLLPVILIVFISLINPQYMSVLYSTPIGIALLIAAAISEGIGIILIRKIVNVEM
jgi:tight adherence protein B